jgi:8-oxo-dGTP pyrophosphatase MutT (NUDIX family)
MPARQRIPRPPAVEPGPPAPWLNVDPALRRHITLERVRAVMAASDPAHPEPGLPAPAELPGPPRPAAVLVPLFEEDGETRIILTRRAAHLRHHTGEVSFPGGRLEPGEEAVAAALREASEEVGLDPAQVDILGQLAPLTTMSSAAAITPFVGALPSRPVLHPNPAEVEVAFDVALADLLAGGVYREEKWNLPDRIDRPMYFYDLGDDIVWGATARILTELLVLLTRG